MQDRFCEAGCEAKCVSQTPLPTRNSRVIHVNLHYRLSSNSSILEKILDLQKAIVENKKIKNCISAS